jgi:hypothetical protein
VGLESKDPFLVDYKQSVQEVVKGMKNVGASGLRLLMVEMIRSRWIRDKRASYPFEVAWVFDRSEDSVARVLKELEDSKDVEQVGLRGGKKGLAKPYRPGSLRKIPKIGKTAKASRKYSSRA